jgi:hypothetical protein
MPFFHLHICEIVDKKTSYNEGCLYVAFSIYLCISVGLYDLIWWFDFRLEPIFVIALKNTSHFILLLLPSFSLNLRSLQC